MAQMKNGESGTSSTMLWVLGLVLAAMSMLGAGCIEYPNCETDDHCMDKNPERAVEYCLNGTCQECRQDSHCAQAGHRCVGGACEKIPGWCKSDTDCVGKQKCWESQCGPECRADGDCGDGEVCKNGACQLASECVVDADCPAGKSCKNNTCVDKVGGSARECDKLRPIYFDFDESALRAETRETLRDHAECVKERSRSVQIEGHCDDRGTEAYNLALGERRARSAQDYMVSLGAKRGSLSTLSYGESKPADFGGGESSWQKNRRCEFNWR